MQRTVLGVLLLLVIFSSDSLFAQVPDRLSYQGMLTGVAGEAVEDGVYPMHFKLYGDSDPSLPLWFETQEVTVVKGIFSVILGTVNPLALPFDGQYYIGIAVGEGSELSPRIALTSSAYSFRTRSVDDGEVVKSINELRDHVLLEAGANVSITEEENKIIISASGGGEGGGITQITAGEGLIGGGTVGNVTLSVQNQGITTGKLADGAVTGNKIADDQAVRSINNLTDAVHLSGEGGATVTMRGDTLVITAGSGGDGSGIQGIQNTNNTLDILNPSGPTTTVNIKTGGVGTRHIADNAITAVKIANGSVTPEKIDFPFSFETTETGSAFHIINNTQVGIAIIGEAKGSIEFGAAIGVYGKSESPEGLGIYGVATSPSGTTVGVKGISNSKSGSGVNGWASAVSGTTYGVYGISSSSNGRGIYGLASANSGDTYGVYGVVNSPDGYAGYFTGGRNYFQGNVGIKTDAPQAELHVGGVNSNADILLKRNDATHGFNFGVNATPRLFIARSDGASFSDIMVIDGSTDRVGIGTANPGFLLHVNGDAGKPGGGSWSNTSDERLKRNVQPIQKALSSLLSLKGVTYEYIDPTAVNELPGTRIGMIAQQVRSVFPDWITESNDGYLRLTYRGFEALVVEAVRELHNTIEVLHTENAELRSRLNALEMRINNLANH
jgi:hypothetical protein